jgi:hypothetical protein
MAHGFGTVGGFGKHPTVIPGSQRIIRRLLDDPSVIKGKVCRTSVQRTRVPPETVEFRKWLHGGFMARVYSSSGFTEIMLITEEPEMVMARHSILFVPEKAFA